MFNRIKEYFFKPYKNSDYLTRQRALIFLAISFMIFFIVVFYHISFRMRGNNDLAVLTPLTITGIVSLISLFFLRRGFLRPVPHLLLITCLSATWFTLFFENADAIGRMDTIVLILGILYFIPLVINRRKIFIVIYFFINMAVFLLFTEKVQNDFGLSNSVIFEYAVDVVLTFIIAGILSYLIFTVYTNTLQRVRQSELTVQEQYKEIERQNEEMAAANEELEVINEDLISVHDKLSQEKELLSTTLRSIEDAVITTDREGNIVLMNRTAEMISQCMAIEARGKPFDRVMEIHSTVTGEPLDNPALLVINNGGFPDHGQDLVLHKNDGSKLDITLTGAPIHDMQSCVTGTVLVLRDITEAKKIETELQKVSKIETLGVFAGGIAHDFNNIVASAMGNISMAKSIIKNDDQIREYIISAEEALLKTKDLTHQLLTFTKGGEPLKETASIKEIIKNAVKFVLSGCQIKWFCDFPGDLWNVMIDKGQISQVIHNIVLNSRQAMSHSGRIDISAENRIIDPGENTGLKEGSYIKIVISDEGPGISEEAREKIFDPFFTTKKEGSGLGLALSYSIVKRHGGYIDLNVPEDKGASFTIFLPATREEVMKKPEESDSPVSRPGKILLLDDDENILNIVKKMLVSIGFETAIASTGEDAIELYRNAKDSGEGFDCVIMDLTIYGGMGGEQALQILREYDKDILAVVSSGYANNPIIANFRDHGFSGAIQKPFRLEELREVLAQVTNKN